MFFKHALGKSGRYRVFSKILLIIQILLIYWQEIVLRLFREAIQELYPKHKLHLAGKIALQIKWVNIIEI